MCERMKRKIRKIFKRILAWIIKHIDDEDWFDHIGPKPNYPWY
jgi:hypothetical protein